MNARYHGIIRHFLLVFLLGLFICVISYNANGQTITYKDLVGRWKCKNIKYSWDFTFYADNTGSEDGVSKEHHKPFIYEIGTSPDGNILTVRTTDFDSLYSIVYRLKKLTEDEIYLVGLILKNFNRSSQIWEEADLPANDTLIYDRIVTSDGSNRTITYKDLIGTWKLIYKDNQIESLEFKDSVNLVARSMDDLNPVSRKFKYCIVNNKIKVQNIGSDLRYTYKIKSFSKNELQIWNEGSEVYEKTKKIWFAIGDSIVRNLTLKRQR